MSNSNPLLKSKNNETDSPENVSPAKAKDVQLKRLSVAQGLEHMNLRRPVSKKNVKSKKR